MQSSDLCLCLDKCKKSIYASAVAHHYLHLRKSKSIFYHHNMASGLHELVKSISVAVNLPIVILFQHPSPSKDKSSRSAIAAAAKSCIAGLIDLSVDSVYFVHDCHPSATKNCWSSHELKSVALSKCANSDVAMVNATEPSMICAMNEDAVSHPVFGNVQRSGWAKTKKGVEMSFHIKLNK